VNAGALLRRFCFLEVQAKKKVAGANRSQELVISHAFDDLAKAAA
jgi:hypothetical protein